LASVAGDIPVSHPGPTDVNLTAALGGAVLDTTPGYANIVQIRMTQTGSSNAYYTADISYDSAAGTWSQVYPAVVASTTTTLTATPSPATVGDTVTLNATVTPSGAAGTVQFKDGASNIGAPVTVTSGAASTTTSTLAAGSHSLSAVFTPNDPTSFGGSTGTFTEQVNPPATPTSTTLAVSGGYLTAGSSATLTASVTGPGSTANGAGTVAFYDNGSATAVPGTLTTGPTGTYTLTVDSGFSAGSHSIVAKFAPTDVNVYQASQSAPQSFLTQAAQVGACAQPGSVCTDTQNVTATVPVGTLVINTPYTAAAPLDLGTLVLDPTTSATLTGSAAFQHIVVTDTRSGNLPWTVQAVASNLSDGGSNPNSVINAQNLGLTGLAQTSSGAGFTGVLTYTNRAAANGVAPGAPGSAGLGGGLPQTIITTDHGLGTVDINGTLTLIAPSSTEPGTFAGTITFTVG
ncbi:MAG TPA: Ig-like domain-containing protein, partial [Jatrophihabitans sp.]|nr:Ig-like domain-containing protein [Jatrophihabitans sp.]